MASNFEAVFADQANAVLSERLPSILPKRIGFELLDKNEDDTQAVGVSGFRVANKWVFIPCFFTAGKIQGQEMMYLKDNDLFCPATEAWLEYLSNNEAVDLGKPMDASNYKTQPLNLTDILRPPFVRKSGSINSPIDLDDVTLSRMIPPFAKSANKDENDAVLEYLHGEGPQGDSLLLKAIRRSPKMASNLAHNMAGNPEFAEAMLRYYTMDDLERATEPIKRAADATESSVVSPSVVITGNKQIVDGPGRWKVMGFSQDEIEILVFRTGNSTWFIYDPKNEYGQEVASLSRLGFWGVLEDPMPSKSVDDFSKATVLSHQSGCGGQSDYHNRSYMIVQKDRVLWRGSIEDVIKSGKDITFKVFTSYANSGPVSRSHTSEIVNHIIVSPNIKKPGTIRTGLQYNDDVYSLLLPRDGTEFLHIAGEALPPAMTWEMAIAEASKGNTKAANLRIDFAGDFLIRCGSFSAGSLGYKKAHSVLTHNLGVEDGMATELLKLASLSHCTKALVKYGAGFPAFFDTQNESTNFGGYPAEQSKTDNIAMPQMMEDKEVARVMHAADTGQKRVFDVGVLTSLANAKGIDGTVDDNLPDVIQGMDRIGRILFLFYWKYDKFADRYGDQDVAKLHDSLKDTFEALGDLIMFLKDKPVSGHKERVQESSNID